MFLLGLPNVVLRLNLLTNHFQYQVQSTFLEGEKEKV